MAKSVDAAALKAAVPQGRVGSSPTCPTCPSGDSSGAFRTVQLDRQLEVAVALTLAPRVFLMDEPMAGLGAEGTKAMTAFLDGLRSEAPILLVEHDMDAVFALADRISVLVYGQVIATGAPDEIRRDPAVREAYLGEEAT